MRIKLITALVFILTASFYILTLSPSLAWGDGVKLQTEAITGESFLFSEMPPQDFTPDAFIFSKVGVAAWDHPLYIMLGRTLVKTFPSANPLWLVNLISAVFGAASVTVVFLIAHRLTLSIVASAFAAFALAVSHTFWWHSSTPEVYTLFIFLLLVSYIFFDEYEKSKQNKFLIGSAFFLGLAASNHILAFLALPAFGLYSFLSKRYPRFEINSLKKFVFLALGFLLGFSLYIVQFIRVTRALSINETVGPALGSTFLSRLDFFSPTVLGNSLLTYAGFLAFQFGPLGIFLGIFGIRRAFVNADASPRKAFAFFIVFMLFGIFYRVTDQFAFFLTSYVFFAILMALGANHFFTTLRIKPRFILTFILFLTILLTPSFYRSVPRLAERNGVDDSFLGIPQIGVGLRDGFAYYIDPNKRGDFNAYNFGNETLTKLPPNAVVIAEWYTDTDEYFIFRYFQKVEGLRPDVTILGWPTDDPFMFDSQLVVNAVEDSFPERPVYLASLSEKFYAAPKLIEAYCIVPENNLYRVYEQSASDSQCLRMDSISP
ncbi:MAG: hypothetical protein DCC56_00190 [Anaerolineae bacterium]|nr:MAG: hypothetical protein DCC56_00190 [Anaerolineae bacterium]WKZ44450.1 MAG: DUF2723 domain-containing protein [Anaerolineales bacterium]